MDESERIKRVYAQRARDGADAQYTLFSEASLYLIQSREWEVLKILKREGFFPLRDKRALDVGCGDGGGLERLLAYGASPHNLYGVDLLPERVWAAKNTNPRLGVVLGNAERLPFADRSFDLVTQFTVFSSILDIRMRQAVAAEMLRVLKPCGMILWYDLLISNPRNPNVRGLARREIEALFAGCRCAFYRTTLAPPLARALIRYSRVACHLLEKVPALRTHYLATIRMNDATT